MAKHSHFVSTNHNIFYNIYPNVINSLFVYLQYGNMEAKVRWRDHASLCASP
jgi:hypothetical protein